MGKDTNLDSLEVVGKGNSRDMDRLAVGWGQEVASLACSLEVGMGSQDVAVEVETEMPLCF